MNRSGTATFVLHTHLPYCRLAGNWPHGEEWIHEALLECYLPLIAAFRRLSSEVAGSIGVTINMTPILTEQLADPLVLDHFRTYLDDRLGRAEADVERFRSAGGLRAETARFHRDRFAAMHDLFEHGLHGDFVGALGELEAGGHLEIATSAATHGYLPLLEDDAAVEFQVATGVQSHLRHFGRAPRSFWLPECAYKPGVERILERHDIRVFFVETHLVTGGETTKKAAGGMLGLYPAEAPVKANNTNNPHGTTFQPYFVGDSAVAVIARNERSGKQVWSAADGYPGDGAYREFHKKDDTSGLHYWRVTGDGIDLGMKEEYDPAAASLAAKNHAQHFVGIVQEELHTYLLTHDEPGLLLSAYDTELFGHWWMEGVDWLEATIRRLAEDQTVTLTTAGSYVVANPPRQRITLPEGSWGAGGDHRTWSNDTAAWTWPEVHSRQARAARLLGQDARETRQLARELLLLQASDWQFLMTTGQANEYATLRFRSHCDRFDALAAAIEKTSPDLESLVTEYEALDNPFPNIDPRAYRAPSFASMGVR